MLRLRFFLSREAGDHLSERGGQGAGKSRNAAATRSSCGRGHSVEERCGQCAEYVFCSGGLRGRSGQSSLQAVFQHLVRRKIFQLQKKIGGHLEGFLGNQADDFTSHRSSAVAFRFALDHFIYAMHRRVFEIGEVDGNLREIPRLQGDAHRFDVAQTTGGKTNGFGNFVGDGNVRGVEVDVVGDEELARADDGGSRGGMELGIANVGATFSDCA